MELQKCLPLVGMDSIWTDILRPLFQKINRTLHHGCFLIHATNNYFYRKRKMRLSGRHVCKFKKDNLVSKKIFQNM